MDEKTYDLELYFDHDIGARHNSDAVEVSFKLDSYTTAIGDCRCQDSECRLCNPIGPCSTIFDDDHTYAGIESISFQNVWCHAEMADHLTQVMASAAHLKRLRVVCSPIDFVKEKGKECTYPFTLDNNVYLAISEGLVRNEGLQELKIEGEYIVRGQKAYDGYDFVLGWRRAFLVEGLRVHPSLLTLKIQGVYLSREPVLSLAESIRDNNVLKNLSLRACSLDDKRAYSLAEGLTGCQSLQSLDVSLNDISYSGAYSLIELRLRVLDIRETGAVRGIERMTKLHPDCVVHWGAAREPYDLEVTFSCGAQTMHMYKHDTPSAGNGSRPTLDEITYASRPPIAPLEIEAACARAESLYLGGVGCYPSLARLVIHAMESCLRFCVACGKMGLREEKAWLNNAHVNEGRPVVDQTQNVIYAAVSEGLEKSKRLKTLTIQGEYSCLLQDLNGEESDFDRSFKWRPSYLVAGLTRPDATLLELNIICVSIRRGAATELARAIASRNMLKRLTLEECSLCDDCAISLAVQLAECRSLVGLNVTHNRICDNGAKALVGLHLRRLDVRWNETTIAFHAFMRGQKQYDCAVYHTISKPLLI